MATLLSRDSRQEIMCALEGDPPSGIVALHFEVSHAATVKVIWRFRRSGSPAPARIVFVA